MLSGRALLRFSLFVLPALLLAAVFLLYPRTQKLELTAYLRDARQLKAGAPVMIAGVDAGRVVAVRPAGDEVEISMAINLAQVRSIPSDAVVTLGRAGVLGETIVIIELANSSGAPLGNRGVLRRAPPQRP